MKKLVFSLLLTLAGFAFAGSKDPSFDLDAMPLGDVIRVVYAQAFPDRAYFLDPAVLLDQRPVSFRYKPSDGDVRSFLAVVLRSLGYSMEERNKADVVRPMPQAQTVAAVEDSSLEIFHYRPRFREVGYLVDMLSPLFRGKFTAQKAIVAPVGSGIATSGVPAPPGSALAQVTRSDDQLLFVGSPKEVSSMKKLLAQVDVDPGQVFVSGALYEVQTSDREGSALQLAASVLGGRFGVNIGAAVAADNFVSVRTPSVTAIVQALQNDSRFKVLSSPSVRVKSGSKAVFNVGQDVPVLGAITYPQGGSSPVQSVEYRSSGVIFSISPQVRDGVIDVSVDQQVSSFVTTTTGVNNSPTLTKRQLSTNVSMGDGDVVVIGGLREDKSSSASSGLGFLPRLLDSRSHENGHSEILLFLQLQKI